ncbi:hypothetical protein MMC19_007708 [Ptychographa xylographoides]|nr:hypothetical protein [Ptychographa xylographoides]
MNGGDTIRLKNAFQDSHRIKRIKLGQEVIRNNGLTRRSISDHKHQDGGAEDDTVKAADKTKLDRATAVSSLRGNTDGQSVQTLTTAMPGSASSLVEQVPEILAATDSISPYSTGLSNTDGSTAITPNIDFTAAPSDPIELAWWVAQQISHFRPDDSDRGEPEAEGRQRKLLAHAPGMHTRQSDAYLEPQQIAEREKLREENRERKKRWRESNAERNKDNDLRCRINKRAKAKFGKDPSAGKTAYIETEYNKRRNKSELKQRARAIRTGEFPNFIVTPELSHRIFSIQNPHLSRNVQTAGKLLMNALFVVGTNGNQQGATEAADALRLAVIDGVLDPGPFVEALRVMAMNAELMKSISAKLDSDGDDEELEALSGDEISSQQMHLAESRSESASSQTSALNHQSADIIRALNAATALLNQMADTKAYASPYGNPPPIALSTNGQAPETSNGSKQSTSSKPSADGHGLDQSQIDALLALANGGSLTDDEDDKTIADPDELNGRQLDPLGMPQTDSDITATLERIINQLTAERTGTQPIDETLVASTSKYAAESYGLQSLQDQAATLQSLFTQAGVSINTIIPAAQSHATSQLYAHLSNRARSSTPCAPSAAHASSLGNNVQMQQRMLPSPSTFGTVQYQQQRELQVALSTSRGNIAGASLRSRNPEEQRKIRSYGFPPLPGNRPGAKKI